MPSARVGPCPAGLPLAVCAPRGWALLLGDCWGAAHSSLPGSLEPRGAAAALPSHVWEPGSALPERRDAAQTAPLGLRPPTPLTVRTRGFPRR